MDKAKFLERVRVDESGCWLWTGMITRKGYGTFKVGGRAGRYVRAHRLAYALWRGPIAPGLLVCHRCDVRACVNPEHLFLGSHADNVHDMIAKGRACLRGLVMRGESNPRTKLSDADVNRIRRSRASSSDLARRFSVFRSTISRIRRGERRRHAAS